MKKVGVITHYYNSLNYGGNFQAYALVKFLNDNGCNAVQIPYDRSDDWPFSKMSNGLVKRFVRFFKKPQKEPAATELSDEELQGIKRRNSLIAEFNTAVIPHCRVFCKKDLKKIGEFDAFVVGSDQVWHPKAVCSAYLLDFDTGSAKKLSYAASFAVNALSDDVKPYYKKCLSAFDAVSVRENSGKDIVKDLIGRDAECAVDPTLLLSKEDWDAVCKDIALPEKYVFCYFLSPCASARRKASEYARSINAKTVFLPYIAEKICTEDKSFGDVRLFDVSPEQLLTVVKNAAAVFTDSFHITVFSLIFKRTFFAFGRSDYSGMGSRLQTLLSMFDMEDRFFPATEQTENLSFADIPAPNYEKRFVKFENAVKKSTGFLKNNLG